VRLVVEAVEALDDGLLCLLDRLVGLAVSASTLRTPS